MTTISSANSSLLYAYGVSEQTTSQSQTVSNGITSSTDTLSEQTQSMYADDGNQKDTVSISSLTESFSSTSEGYWLPSKNGGLGDFCTAGTTVNGVDAKDIPGAVAGTLSISLTTGKAVAGTYSETGAGVEAVKSFSISDNKGNISASFTSIETKEIDSLFGIDENQGSNTQKLSNNKLVINA